MTDSRKISVAIPAYNRTDLLFDCFQKVYNDERIQEIVISDDCSDPEIYSNIKEVVSHLPKVILHRNEVNLDCFRNKKRAVELASSDWVCLWDSDNEFNTDYLDRLFAIPEWDINTIYTPNFAEPTFDFTPYAGLTITKENVSQYIDKPMFEVCLNAANYFVNRDNYINVWDGSIDPVTSDSIYVCLKWLEHGNKINIVHGLRYHHRIHDSSHYNSNVTRTPVGLHQSILTKLRQLT